MPMTAAQSPAAGGLVDALLPGTAASDPITDLADTKFIDGRNTIVAVSPVDQLATAFVQRLVTDQSLGSAAVIQLPRSDQQHTILLAICTHLLLSRRRPLHVGPVVLASLDLNLTERLRDVKVQNRRRMGLAEGNPLGVHRLRRDGTICEHGGTPRRANNSALIYYNPRVGQPELVTDPPVVLVDCTTVRSPAIRTRVIEWAQRVNAVAVVLVGDLGDTGMRDSLFEAGYVPTVLPMTPDVLAALSYTLGGAAVSESRLSTAHLLSWRPGDVEVRQVDAPKINQRIEEGFRALAGRPNSDPPFELDHALKLLRNGTRLASSVEAYRAACRNNLRPGEQPTTLLRRLDRSRSELRGEWRGWGMTGWPRLRFSTIDLWENLQLSNPKRDALWSALEDAAADDGPIVIRCHSRAAAEATLADLSKSESRSERQQELWERIGARVMVCRFSDRMTAGSLTTQIITGSPPPWHLSMLMSAEAARTVVLAYPAEADMLAVAVQRWHEALHAWRVAAFRTLGLARPESYAPGIVLTGHRGDGSTPLALSTPDLDLMTVLDSARDIIDSPEHNRPALGLRSVAGTRTCVPVHLADGRTWWVVDEEDGGTPVLTVDAGGHGYRPIRDLRAGVGVVVPAGDGTESIHARLVAASRTNTDVAALELILSQFRNAARSLLQRHPTRQLAIDCLSAAGAQHPAQLSAWAAGTTIAPREPGDVEAVFAASGRPMPDLALVYSVANTLRQLGRTLGKFIDAIAGGTNTQALEQLRAIVGDAADDIVEEFVTVDVTEVGDRREVPAGLAGRAVPNQVMENA